MSFPAASALVRHRVIRFLLTGGVCGLVQLGALVVFTTRGVEPLIANLGAFTLAAHLNFVMSSTFTWRDRRGGSIAARWIAFLVAVSGTALLNLAVFEVSRTVVPVMLAALAGIAAAATLNFLLGDRAIFRAPAAGVNPPRPVRASSPTLASTERSQ